MPIALALDSRRPILLDHHGWVLEIVAGHVDIFAVDVGDGGYGGRHHLFRVESGDIVSDLRSAGGLSFIAVGTDGSRASARCRAELSSEAQATRWIERLARFVAGPAPLWQLAEVAEGEAALPPGACGRGPMRACSG
ncbi:hypothetical protein ACQ86E_22950 [Bradyrhizobium betae]|uniref:hypothetical protein n=1 Tax=Bradyrhizobium betae TaxID=244734 RepID=UPI003D670CC3